MVGLWVIKIQTVKPSQNWKFCLASMSHQLDSATISRQLWQEISGKQPPFHQVSRIFEGILPRSRRWTAFGVMHHTNKNWKMVYSTFGGLSPPPGSCQCPWEKYWTVEHIWRKDLANMLISAMMFFFPIVRNKVILRNWTCHNYLQTKNIFKNIFISQVGPWLLLEQTSPSNWLVTNQPVHC